MQIIPTEAKTHLTELVLHAGVGHEIFLFQHRRAAVRPVPIAPIVDAPARRRPLESL